MRTLTDKQIKELTIKNKQYSVFFGQGLNLQISPLGTKTWRFFYYLAGKQEKITLGRYPSFSLNEALSWMVDSRKLIDRGISPKTIKKGLFDIGEKPPEIKEFINEYINRWLPALTARKEKTEERLLIKHFAHRWLDDTVARKNKREFARMINKDIIGTLGDISITRLSHADILKMVDAIKARGANNTAIKNFAALKRILNYAITRGLIDNNPADRIERRYVGTSKIRTKTLTPAELGELFREIYRSSNKRQYALALHLLLITMVRKSELRLAKWQELDFDKNEWIIPETRMKKGRPHAVYLSKQAKRIFIELKGLAGSSLFVLPAKDKPKIPIARLTLNIIFNAIRINLTFAKDLVIHDFRRTASTILHENEFNSDWIEKALAHEQRGVRAVYNKAQYAAGRRQMLQWWADYVDEQIGSYL